MKKQRNRILSITLSLLLLTGIFPCTALAIEEPSYEYGIGEYYSAITKDYVTDRFEYTDQWFFENAVSRNDRLALISAQLAASAADAIHGTEFLRALGFENAEAKRYQSEQSDDCAYNIGTKTLSAEGKNVTLAAVVFQGAEYGSEGWQQNVCVNGETEGAPNIPDHVAFSRAADYFLSDLADLDLSGEVIFWLTGQSRGGAIANLAAARLCQNTGTDGKKSSPLVFACTFESPATTDSTDAHEPVFRGIHNYICDDDLVTMLPVWGMTRYGQDILFNTATIEEVRTELKEQNPDAFALAQNYSAELFGGDVRAYAHGLADKLALSVPERAEYSTIHTDLYVTEDETMRIDYSYQNGLQAFCHIAFENGNNSLSRIMMPLFTILPDLTYSYLEEVYANEKKPADSALLRSDAVRKRWNAAIILYHTIAENSGNPLFSQEDLYALLKILSPLFIDTTAVTGPDGTLPDYNEEITDYFDLAGVLALTSAGSSTLLFSHQPDMILARLKLLAPSPGREKGISLLPASNYPECLKDASCPMSQYTDLKRDSWYHDGVHWALDTGIMNGYGGETFGPDDFTTRAMIVTTLWRMENEPETSFDTTFQDVTAGEWYSKAVRWAAGNGIVKGYNEKAFAPDDLVTREQIVTILYRYSIHLKLEITGTTADLSTYTDAQNVSAWSESAVRWGVGTGIIQGTGNHTLDPRSGATRAQIATMLLRQKNYSHAK